MQGPLVEIDEIADSTFPMSEEILIDFTPETGPGCRHVQRGGGPGTSHQERRLREPRRW